MDTPDPVTTQTPFAVTVSRPERLFPKLTPAQLARITSHGRRRATSRSEVLVDVGNRVVPCFVVVAGEIQALGSYRWIGVGWLIHGKTSPHPVSPNRRR